MILYARDTQRAPSSDSLRKAIERLIPCTKHFAARIAVRPFELYGVRRHARNGVRRRAVAAISILLGTGILLSGCTAAPDYDAPAVYNYDYPASASFDFDSWGWHVCDCEASVR